MWRGKMNGKEMCINPAMAVVGLCTQFVIDIAPLNTTDTIEMTELCTVRMTFTAAR